MAEREITLYERENFLGRKWVFREDTCNVDLNVNVANMSMKVKGDSSWSVYDEADMRGNVYQIQPGAYSSLDHYHALPLHGIHSIKSDPIQKRGIAHAIQMPLQVLRKVAAAPVQPNKYPHGVHYTEQWAALGAWFLGTKGENINMFNDLVVQAFKANRDFRNSYFPTDPRYITHSITCTEAYQNSISILKQHLNTMMKELQNSLPMTSIRFQGHMNWDTTMPANLGYLAAFLYNANNVANEASAVTTLYEIHVGEQLCEMLGFSLKNSPRPWGHITADGSIANIEALWSSRNLKFYPLAVQKALQTEPVLKKAIGYKVFVPAKNAYVKLVDLDVWTMLNLNIDDVIKIPKDITALLNLPDDDKTTYTEAVDTKSLANVGWVQFSQDFKFNQPVVIAPKTMHYSWPKAATLLGIGPKNIRGVAFDEYARMDIADLENTLKDCLQKKIPVMSVVAVIGTTEESAVDPLSEIVKLRIKYAKKGLNFVISADAAWGGYFMTMLHDPLIMHLSKKGQQGYIPAFSLSPYTETQLRSLQYADTITIDPHKSGFCPYPAGGLTYRNGGMRGFVKVEADVVFHETKDPSVGIWGVEGSKPGAAAAGVLLSHQVIGLDKLGYGRILGQCVLGASLFYCTWMTLAKEDDNFVCVPMLPIPKDLTITVNGQTRHLNEDEAKVFIKDFIIGKTDEQLKNNPVCIDFLKQIGPDTLINAFAVNYKNNNDLDKCNALSFEVFRRLSHTSDLIDIRRIPMILTQSKLSDKDHDKTCAQFKQRLGVPATSAGGVNFLINTVMNPWATDQDQIQMIAGIFRQTVLDAIGMLTDTPMLHGFVCAGTVSDTGVMFGDHLPMFHVPPHQYHAIAKFQFQNQNDIKTIIKKQKDEMKKPVNKRQPLIIGPKNKEILEDFLYRALQDPFEMECRIGMPSGSNPAFVTTLVKVLDVPRCKHFDFTLKEYPQYMSYFLYGDKDKAYLSHNMTKDPDFHQVVELDEKPHSVPAELLELGFDINITDMKGSPLVVNGQIVDPLQLNQYTVEFTSLDNQEVATTISMEKEGCKIWFDSKMLNKK